MSTVHPPTPVLHAADLVLLVVRPELPSISAAAAALRSLRTMLSEHGSGPETLGLAVVGEGTYSAGEIGKQLAVPVRLDLPFDDRSARALTLGGTVRHAWPLLKRATQAEPELRAAIARRRRPHLLTGSGGGCLACRDRVRRDRTAMTVTTAPPTSYRRARSRSSRTSRWTCRRRRSVRAGLPRHAAAAPRRAPRSRRRHPHRPEIVAAARAGRRRRIRAALTKATWTRTAGQTRFDTDRAWQQAGRLGWDADERTVMNLGATSVGPVAGGRRRRDRLRGCPAAARPDRRGADPVAADADRADRGRDRRRTRGISTEVVARYADCCAGAVRR